MTLNQSLISIFIIVFGTMLTRFLPFIIYGDKRPLSPFVQYLGKVLPTAAIGLLVIYALKDTQILQHPYGIPEALAIGAIIIVHRLWRQSLLSIGTGTILYMVLVQFFFN